MSTKRALIIEDEIILRKYLINLLKKTGCEVVGETSSGKKGIELAETTCPDIIFIDIKLEGGLDGIETARQLSSKTTIPIVIMSAYDYENKILNENISNYFAFLGKPVNEKVLENILKKIP